MRLAKRILKSSRSAEGGRERIVGAVFVTILVALGSAFLALAPDDCKNVDLVYGAF